MVSELSHTVSSPFERFQHCCLSCAIRYSCNHCWVRRGNTRWEVCLTLPYITEAPDDSVVKMRVAGTWNVLSICMICRSWMRTTIRFTLWCKDKVRIYLLACRNLLWDILRLPSSRRAALGLYVILTLWRGRGANQPPYALLHMELAALCIAPRETCVIIIIIIIITLF